MIYFSYLNCLLTGQPVLVSGEFVSALSAAFLNSVMLCSGSLGTILVR